MSNPLESPQQLHQKLERLREVCAQIGQPPEPPPTLRGKVGAKLVGMVRRMLFWYTPPLQSTLEGLTQVLDEMVEKTESMQRILEQQALKASSEEDIALVEQRLQALVLEREHLRGEEWKEWLRQEGAQRGNLDYLHELGVRLKAQEEDLQQERLRGDVLEENLRQERLKREEIENRLREQGETLLRECLRNDELEKGLRAEHAYREGLEDRVNEQGQRVNAFDDHFHSQSESLDQERRRITEMFQQERVCTIELEGRFREQVDSLQQLQEEQRFQEYTDRLRDAEERLRRLGRELVEHSQRVSRLLEEARKRLPEPFDRGQLEAFEEENCHDLDLVYAALEEKLGGSREEHRRHLKTYLPVLQKARPADGEFTVLDLGSGRGIWLELLRQEGFQARGVEFNRSLAAECRQKQLDVESADALEYLGRVPDVSVGAVTVFHMVEYLPFRKLIRLLDEITRVLQPGGVAILETPNVGSREFYLDPARRNPIPDETLRFLVESRGLCQVKVAGSPAPDGPEVYAVIGRKV